MVAHINEHYSQAKQAGVKSPVMDQISQFLAKAAGEIAKLKAIDQQAATMSAGAPGAPAVPAGAPTAPPAPPVPGQPQ